MIWYEITQYSTLNVKLSNSQLNKLRSGIKKGNQATLNLSSNFIGDSNDEVNFPYKLLWTIHKFQRFIKLLQTV